MRSLIPLVLVLLSFGCSTKADKPKAVGIVTSEAIDTSLLSKKSDIDNIPEAPNKVRNSTRLDDHTKDGLKELSDAGVFDASHEYHIKDLKSIHDFTFDFKPEIKLVSKSNGDIFLNNRTDHFFIAYDGVHNVISFISYNDLTKEYWTLYQDVRVENEINQDSCNYGAQGTLDYQLAEELVWHKEGFIEKPISLLEYGLCQISPLQSNRDIVLESGCYSRDFAIDNSHPSLCIATSLVYNNWECMNFDIEKKLFSINYGQAFAD